MSKKSTLGAVALGAAISAGMLVILLDVFGNKPKEKTVQKTNQTSSNLEQRINSFQGYEGNSDFQKKVLPETLNFINKCENRGVKIFDERDISKISFRNIKFVPISGGTECLFNADEYTFKYAHTSNSKYTKDFSGITLCNLNKDNPWVAMTANNTNLLNKISEKYSGRGSFEEGIKIITNLASAFQDGTENYSNPAIHHHKPFGYDLNIISATYRENTLEDVPNNLLSIREMYVITPVGENKAKLITYMKLKAGLKDISQEEKENQRKRVIEYLKKRPKQQ